MELRKCKKCDFTAPKEEFPFNGYVRGKPYWRRLCFTCYRAKRRQERSEFRDMYRKWKGGLECSNCGYSAKTHESFSSSALEFHHMLGEKEFNVSEAFSQRVNFDRLIKEAAKCIVLCCRCHMEHHHPSK